MSDLYAARSTDLRPLMEQMREDVLEIKELVSEVTAQREHWKDRAISAERDLADAEARIAELECPDPRLSIVPGRPEDYVEVEGEERFR